MSSSYLVGRSCAWFEVFPMDIVSLSGVAAGFIFGFLSVSSAVAVGCLPAVVQ